MGAMSSTTAPINTFRGVLGGGGWFNEDSAPLVRRAYDLCGTSPRLLVMPTPLSSLPCDELDGIKTIFGGELGPNSFRVLTDDTQQIPDPNRARELLEWANVVLVMGGNYAENMKRWSYTGIDQMMLNTAETDTVFTGASTGLISWFTAAQTVDTPLGEPNDKQYYLHRGLRKLPALVSAHYDNFQSGTGIPRSVSFTEMMATQPIGTVGVGVTNFGYVEIDKDTVQVGRTHRYAGVHRLLSTPSGVDLQMFGSGDKMSYSDFFLV